MYRNSIKVYLFIVYTISIINLGQGLILLSDLYKLAQIGRDGRAVEGARLESVYTATYRGFESLSLRQV